MTLHGMGCVWYSLDHATWRHVPTAPVGASVALLFAGDVFRGALIAGMIELENSGVDPFSVSGLDAVCGLANSVAREKVRFLTLDEALPAIAEATNEWRLYHGLGHRRVVR